MNADNFDELIPMLSPNVENQLKYCLANEVKLYSTNAHGKKCWLCPFRTFYRSSRLQKYLKYHCEKNMYMAYIQSPQLLLIRSYYDYFQFQISYKLNTWKIGTTKVNKSELNYL